MSPTIKLNDGHEMPQVGFGLWKVGNDVCADTVYNAIKAGYRLLDGACGKFSVFSFFFFFFFLICGCLDTVFVYLSHRHFSCVDLGNRLRKRNLTTSF